MGHISKLISTATRLTGSSARVTLGKTQILKAVDKQDTKAGKELAKVFGKMKDPKIDVAYKASERGYTVGAFRVRDGKQVLASGAGSVTNLGKEDAVFKMRLNAGRNGDVFSYSAFNDHAHSPRIQDYEVVSSLKKGVLETTTKNGKAAGVRMRLDIPKAVESVGLKEEGALIAKKANKVLEDYTQFARDIFTGKINI